MTDRRWKQIERLICAVFGGHRSGPTGTMDCDCSGSTEPFAVEVKHGRSYSIPAWLRSAIEQSERNAKKRGPDWLSTLVIHEAGSEIGDSLVIFRLKDFAEWYLSPHVSEVDI